MKDFWTGIWEEMSDYGGCLGTIMAMTLIVLAIGGAIRLIDWMWGW